MGQAASNPSIWEPNHLSANPRNMFGSISRKDSREPGYSWVDDSVHLLNTVVTVGPLAGLNRSLGAAGLLTIILDCLRNKETDLSSDLCRYVDESIAKSSMTAIKAKLAAIQNAMEIIIDSSFGSESKRMEAIGAKQLMEEILALFELDDGLKRESLLSSPLLILTAAIFIPLHSYLVTEVDSQYASSMTRFREKLIDLLNTYCRYCYERHWSIIQIRPRCVSVSQSHYAQSTTISVSGGTYTMTIETRWDCRDDFEGFDYKGYTIESYIDSYKSQLKELYESRFLEVVQLLNKSF